MPCRTVNTPPQDVITFTQAQPVTDASCRLLSFWPHRKKKVTQTKKPRNTATLRGFRVLHEHNTFTYSIPYAAVQPTTVNLSSVFFIYLSSWCDIRNALLYPIHRNRKEGRSRGYTILHLHYTRHAAVQSMLMTNIRTNQHKPVTDVPYRRRRMRRA